VTFGTKLCKESLTSQKTQCFHEEDELVHVGQQNNGSMF